MNASPRPPGNALTGSEEESHALPLPSPRCLNKAQAAQYLGIGVTLLMQIGPPPVRLGRRCLYDRVDLDTWLDEYKHRGRAIKEDLWPVKKDSTDARTRRTGGSMRSFQTAYSGEREHRFRRKVNTGFLNASGH